MDEEKERKEEAKEKEKDSMEEKMDEKQKMERKEVKVMIRKEKDPSMLEVEKQMVTRVQMLDKDLIRECHLRCLYHNSNINKKTIHRTQIQSTGTLLRLAVHSHLNGERYHQIDRSIASQGKWVGAIYTINLTARTVAPISIVSNNMGQKTK